MSLLEETTSGFQGNFAFLSNMYPCEIIYNDLRFPSSEHLYQWSKVDPVSDFAYRIMFAHSGRVAKRITREPGFPTNHPTEKRLHWMRRALDAKFNIPELAQKLVDTGDIELVEYNWWNDTFWGVSTSKGKGSNILGNMLMVKRNQLRDAV